MDKLNITSNILDINLLNTFIIDILDLNNCNEEIKNSILLVVEEVFVNISSYAYVGNIGKVLVEAEVKGNNFVIKFYDNGIKFNPLEVNKFNFSFDDINRPLGGLGIYLIENAIDNIAYDYLEKDKTNVLTIEKSIRG